MSGFSNAILGGASKLIRRAIQSPNYDPAAGTGWSINDDGSAVFGDLTIQGISNNLTVDGSGTIGGTLTVSDFFEAETDAEVDGNLTVLGTLTAGNIAVGTALITPSAANTPTSLTVTYGPLTGSTFIGLICAATTVPGTQVTGVAITSVTDTSAIAWVTRTNTTPTRVNYLIFGI